MKNKNPAALAPRLLHAILGLLMLCVSITAHALEPPYLSEFPTAERVLADIRGKGDLDSKAQQMAALSHLKKAIEDLGIARIRTGYLPDEQRIIGTYWEAIYRLQDEAKALLGPNSATNGAFGKWLSQEWKYERDDDVRAANLSRYLSPALRQRLNITNADTDARVRDSNRAMLEGLGIKTSTWDAMSIEEQQSAAGFAVVMALLLALFSIREFRRFGLLPSDPMKLRAGFRLYTLQVATGIVHGYSKVIETTRTTTTTTEKGVSRTSFSVSEVTHERFTLKDGDFEHPVHVINADLDVSNGSLVSAVWGLRRRKKEGDYLVFFDRTLRRNLPIIAALQAALGPTRWLMLPALGIATVVSATTGLWLGLLPRTNGLLRAFLGLFAGWVLMLLILGLWARFRAKRFARRDAPVLLQAIEQREASADRVLPAAFTSAAQT